MSIPMQNAWCFVCGNPIRRATMPPLIWVHNTMEGPADKHLAMPDVDEVRREALDAARDAVAAAILKRGGYHSADEFAALARTTIDALRGES